MCRFPLRIMNKGYKPLDFNSARYVSVPCGHCDECKNKKISDFLYRCTWEFDSTIKKGGFACFLTLTFNRDSLNYVTFEDGSSCSTWNNQLLSKFKSRLQMWLLRLGYSLRYVCTCERGHNGTKRPHYHLILFIVPDSPKVSLSSYEVSLACARFWSWCPRGNSALDISLKYKPFTPNTRFVAKYRPIGFLYNESISRTECEAIKYVVKYCVKDSLDLVWNDSNIVSTTFHISDTDIKPRTTQSNGIGISYLDSVPNIENGHVRIDSNVETSLYILGSRPLASDGTPLNIPRYYIKKLCTSTAVLANYPIEDDSSYFDGIQYTPKFAHDVAKFILVNRKVGRFTRTDIQDIYCYRDRKVTKTNPTIFGTYFSCSSLQESAILYWNILCSLQTYSFNFVDNCNEYYLSLCDPHFLHLVHEIVKRKISFHSLFLLGFRKFFDLYRWYYHHPKNAEYLSNARLLDMFISLVSFSRLYNGIERTSLNAIRYSNNLINSIQQRPLLFIERNE